MSYQIHKRYVDGCALYLIVDSNGDIVSEWEDRDEAEEEMRTLKLDLVDIFEQGWRA